MKNKLYIFFIIILVFSNHFYKIPFVLGDTPRILFVVNLCDHDDFGFPAEKAISFGIVIAHNGFSESHYIRTLEIRSDGFPMLKTSYGIPDYIPDSEINTWGIYHPIEMWGEIPSSIEIRVECSIHGWSPWYKYNTNTLPQKWEEINLEEKMNLNEIIETIVNAAHAGKTILDIQNSISETHSAKNYNIEMTAPIKVLIPNSSSKIIPVDNITMTVASTIKGIIIKKHIGTRFSLKDSKGDEFFIHEVPTNSSFEFYYGFYEDLPDGEYTLMMYLNNTLSEDIIIEYSSLFLSSLITQPELPEPTPEPELEPEEETRGIPGFPFTSILIGLTVFIFVLFYKRF
jgi:hypothetical protein